MNIADLQSSSGRKNCFRIARHMAREERNVIILCCMKNVVGNVMFDDDGMNDIWKSSYMLRITEMVKWSVPR